VTTEGCNNPDHDEARGDHDEARGSLDEVQPLRHCVFGLAWREIGKGSGYTWGGIMGLALCGRGALGLVDTFCTFLLAGDRARSALVRVLSVEMAHAGYLLNSLDGSMGGSVEGTIPLRVVNTGVFISCT